MSTAAEQSAPFAAACRPRPLGDGTFTATLRSEWSIAGIPHGGFLMALLARTAMHVITDNTELIGDPVSVSAEFLRPASIGSALLRTDLRKAGRQTSVVAVCLEQRGRSCLEAVVVVGRLPSQGAVWQDLPMMPAEPPSNAIGLGENMGDGVYRIAQECDVRLDSSAASFVTRRPSRAPPSSLRMRLWVRPRTGNVDLYFGLLAGDINPPIPYALGRRGWAATVQLTSLVRARPAPGWLRVNVESRAVHGHWFDSDATVLDSAGQLICQSRQLALTPGP